MATSTNYGWSEPNNTSLVKDGAQAIRTLGDAIDVSLWNVGYGQAGKNKLINGDFSINQRGFTSNTASGSYNFDRWVQANGGTTGTLTITPQTFTAGAAPVAGYEGKNYVQCVTAAGASTNTVAIFIQRMEDVRTFAGQTVTISFWAKATTGTPKIATEFVQSFGAGGSPSADVFTYAGQSTLSTSWARYSVTVNAPSISGKTVGTTANSSFASIQFWLSGGSDFNSRTGSMGLQNNTFHMWGIQVEYGSKATPFQTASGGSPQAELAMCQRYYQRLAGGQAYERIGYGITQSTTLLSLVVPLVVPLRTATNTLDYGGSWQILDSSLAGTAITSFTLSSGQITSVLIDCNAASGVTAGRYAFARHNNDANAYIGFSAEL